MLDIQVPTSGITATSVALTAGVTAAQSGILVSSMNSEDLVFILTGLALIGFFIGLGQGLAAVPALTWRQVFGKSLVSVGVSLSAVLVLKADPDISPLLIIGCGAVLSILGSGVLEELVRNKLGIAKDKGESNGSGN